MLLKHLSVLRYRSDLKVLPNCKLTINTINAHSYNMAQKDDVFAEALTRGDVLIPDGASIVKATKWLKNIKMERISGWDLFTFEMGKLNRTGGVCFFLGSSVKVLELILQRASGDYPNVRIIGYSPRYKPDFTEDENKSMLDEIHATNPGLILVGMTAPKQEKWVYQHRDLLNVNCHICTIGAVFDFYAGTVKRAPLWWQEHSLEWLYRLMMEPRRMWKRYIIGNFLFICYILKEKFCLKHSNDEQLADTSDTEVDGWYL
ncbi:MAG: WecB/TagA/CpsF family glycosyltransferase [Tannerella sp.]|jgi:N-acetylglucosaminyldiphosphoundecaprenol N-acetyl-beta-D-mannosaminyltransferase|nr:WecB/TagA/CpsF family glycosyltransferase [Tannerella sp.]